MKKVFKYNLVTLMVALLFSVMTVGYALYDQLVALNGNIVIPKSGIIEITSASIVADECSNIASYDNPTYSGMNIDFNITGTSTKFYATYLVEVTNNSFYDYTFTDFAVNVSIENSDKVPKVTTEVRYVNTDGTTGEIVNSGEEIAVGEVITLKIKISMETDSSDVTVNVSGTIVCSEDNSGSIIASIIPTSGNLQGDGTIACFTVSVINSFKYKRTITFTSSNDNIMLVDSSGGTISAFSIDGASTSDYEICTMVREESIFLSEEAKTTIGLVSNGISNVTVGELTLMVDKDVNATDDDIPEVGNVKISVSESNPVIGEATVSWSRIDSGGSSIVNYYVVLYNETTATSVLYSTGNDVTSYTLSNLEEGTYHVLVYGEDEAGNIGSSYCDSATTENGYCSRSESVALWWVANVVYELSGLSTSGADTATLYSNYEATLSLTSTSGYYWLPGSIMVTMGGIELTSGTDYTYNSSTGSIIINSVTDDVTISASAGSFCLIEGTRIRLANGGYKKIEDIEYSDLLAVYDHENGGITYEYPIWMEEKTEVKFYQKTVFSDGTVLKTYGPHSVFSMDLLFYVSVTDQENFKVGTRVAKIKADGSIEVITVSKIEIVYEEVNYYHVSSTRYHNVIAEDLLTTDGTYITTYTYDFNEDITWTGEREDFLKTNDLFYYEDWTHLFPEHIFKGYRMEEAKYVYNQGILDIQYFANILSSLGKNTLRDEKGNNLWMVTTSDDDINGDRRYLRMEGSYYTLEAPINKIGFVGWYNTADNKMYKVGDQVKVVYGMHFIAKYN